MFLTAPDGDTPINPWQDQGVRIWYLRSYTRSPIKLHPPMSRVPMLMAYWDRWAASTGNVGPFCKAVTSRMEGLTSALPNVLRPKDRERVIDVADAHSKLQSGLQHRDYPRARAFDEPQLVEPRPTKQLEDRSEREAA